MKILLIVFVVNGKNYLLLSDDHSIAAYKGEEDLLKAFSGYVDFFRRDMTFRNSAALGMIQAKPIAIEAPENPEDLKTFMVDEHPRRIYEGAIGRGFVGAEVTEDILERKIDLDIFGSLLKIADGR